MDWIAIIAFVEKMIAMCMAAGASDERIAKAIRDPNTRQRRAMYKDILRDVRFAQPELRRREQRAYANGVLDSAVERGANATDAEIQEVIARVRKQSRAA